MGLPHISVCVCTYKRPELLARTLRCICAQQTDGLFTFSIVVADNDRLESAHLVVERLRAETAVAIRYCVEPRQNIARARNMAVSNAHGDYLAFIDDDELPIETWLGTLFRAIHEYAADGVLGPVDPHFDDQTPKWVIKGKFYNRPVHPTGMLLRWDQCRTGNVLLRSDLFASDGEAFRPEFLSGEDQDFFKRQMAQGRRFVWCHEAPAYEVVPPVRWRRRFLVKRALLRGVFSHKNRPTSLLPLARSAALAPAYVAALPVALVFGQAAFMSCTFKLAYHVGRLLAVAGINPIRQPYVTE